MTAEAAQINKADLVRVLTPVAITERDLAQAGSAWPVPRAIPQAPALR